MRALQILALFLLVGCASVAADRPAPAATPLSSQGSMDEVGYMDMIAEQALMIEALQGELIAYQVAGTDYGYVYEVEDGQSLWMIAEEVFGDPYRWNTIYTMNQVWLDDPDLIYPFQVLILP